MRKNLSKKTVIVCFVVFLIIVIIAFPITNYIMDKHSENDKICSNLSNTVYDIVEESYFNYGNISNSKYKDIISAHDYNTLYYLGAIDYDDPQKSYFDRSKMEILISYHSKPTTVVNNNRATSEYDYECEYFIKETQNHIDSYQRYKNKDYTLRCGHITVKWELQNGIWHIVDVVDPP